MSKVKLPDISKINPNLIMILVIMIVGFILYKAIQKGLFSFGGNKILKEQEKEIDKIPVDNSQVTKTDTELKMRADLSLQAMDDIGTNEKMLFEQVSGLNTEELKKVYKFFGNQSERVFGIPVFTGNLINWYYNELGPKDLQKMREIWKNTGLFPN